MYKSTTYTETTVFTREGKEPTVTNAAPTVDTPESPDLATDIENEEATAREAAESTDSPDLELDLENEEATARETATESNVDFKDDYLRLQAEYTNYRKRVERDKGVSSANAQNKVFASLLPVLDSIEAARKHGDLTDGPFAAISNSLFSILASHGLYPINESGIEFDPNIHESVIFRPVEGVESNFIAEVFRTGYQSEHGLIRAAQVMVAE